MTPLRLRRGTGLFSPCKAARAVDAWVVLVTRFTGVTKPAAVEEVEELEAAEVLAGDLVCCCAAEKQVDLVVKLEC